MRTRALAAVLLFDVLAFGTAYAHGDHPASHGGVVGRGDDAMVVEFVMEKGTLVVYVQDEDGKPLPAKDVTGSLILMPPQKAIEEVKLVRVTDVKFTAPELKPSPGDRVRARIRLPTGEQMESVGLLPR
jgi:hypothetical protein